MNIQELYDELGEMLKQAPHIATQQVCVATEDPMVGPSGHSMIKSIASGFDWNTHLFFLFPKDGLVKNPDKCFHCGEKAVSRHNSRSVCIPCYNKLTKV